MAGKSGQVGRTVSIKPHQLSPMFKSKSQARLLQKYFEVTVLFVPADDVKLHSLILWEPSRIGEQSKQAMRK